MLGDLERDHVLLRQNSYPYQVPEDTAHNLLWYKKGVSRQKRVRLLSWLLFFDNLEPGDFMVLRNPPHRRTVPEFSHDHVYTRIKSNGGLGLFRPIPTFVEVAMALAGEPEYTIERAFRVVQQPAPDAGDI